MTIQLFNTDDTVMRQTPDRFNGESPLSLVAATHPVIIMDEPQNMESDLAKSSIADLNALFRLRYSATHKEKHHLMYQLTPVEAYREGLVKKIAVYGVKEDDANELIFRVKKIETGKGSPRARVMLEVKKADGKFEIKEVLVSQDEQIARKSKNERYDDLYVVEIDARHGRVELSDGSVHEVEEEVEDKEPVFRTQIRETI